MALMQPLHSLGRRLSWDRTVTVPAMPAYRGMEQERERRAGSAFVTALSLLAGWLGMLAWERPTAMAAEGSEAGARNAIEADGKADRLRQKRFVSWLASFRKKAESRGIGAEILKRALAGLRPDPEILALVRNQPEHSRTVGAYVGFAASEERIKAGQAKLAEHASLLARIERHFGVDRHILVAIWGLESTYGTRPGERPVIRSLATLAFLGGRRAAFWHEQLIAALKILERGDITPAAMRGSWAGAMGQTQFIPTTFLAFAVDFDGDGRRDIWRSVADAIASAANYLKKSGWRTGQPWGFEVLLPKGFDFGLSGRNRLRPLAAWRRLGVRRADGRPLVPATGRAALILPMGARGPAFLVFRNFHVILRYNQALAYALSIGHLADRLRGGGPLVRAWPEGERGLTFAEREELQRLLVARGYDTGGVDGILGPMTRAAIRAYQRKIGVPADGYAGIGLLERLRREGGGENERGRT